MHIDPLEKFWVVLVGVLTFAMLGVIFYTAFAFGESGFHPPANVETIDGVSMHIPPEWVDDPSSVNNGEFNEANLGVTVNDDGSVNVTMVAARYGFYPQKIEVPVDTPVTVRMATPDVIHGFHVEGTNMASMVLPGYVSEVTTTFNETGEKPMFCNEFCGLGHHYMWGRFTIVPKDEFTPKQGV